MYKKERVGKIKRKQKIKLILDVLMSLLMFFLMGYQFWGDLLHEWAGAAMLLLFIAHHVLNGNWHKNLLKGKYTSYRTLTVIIDVLVLTSMLMQMYSGIVMSRHVFAFLDISGGMALARKLHILGAYWEFALMSIHLGLHWSNIIAMMRKQFEISTQSKTRKIIFVSIGIAISIYGLYAFISRGLADNMLLKNEFVFMDYEESKLSFYLDYLCIAVFFGSIGHYIGKLCKASKGNPVQNK